MPELTSAEYVDQVHRSRSDLYNIEAVPVAILHAAFGITTEGGEIQDHIKKVVFQGRPLDPVNLKEELGDLCWYIALMCRALKPTFEEVWALNINKLKARYSKGFTEKEAHTRNLAKEREILEDEA